MVQILKFVSGKQVVSVLVYLLAFAFALPSDTMAVVMLQAWEEKDLPLRWTHRFSLPDWKLQNTSCKESSAISHLLFTSSPAQICVHVIVLVAVNVVNGMLWGWLFAMESTTHKDVGVWGFAVEADVQVPSNLSKSQHLPRRRSYPTMTTDAAFWVG